MEGERILVTGAGGQVGLPLACALATDNEVWGAARFTDDAVRAQLQAAGVTTRRIDLGAGDLGDLPGDFTYVVHLAAFQLGGSDYDRALAVNAEGTGLLLHHCRRAKGVLVASTASVYAPGPDLDHRFRETDPLGDARPPHAPTYSISKIAEEAVARSAARTYHLPVTIARLNAAYGPNGGLPAYHYDWIAAGRPVPLRTHRPLPYCPIHQHDINEQVGLLLQVASVPATIVNWCGDEVVTVREWCRHLGALAGVEPRFEVLPEDPWIRGSAMDTTRRRQLIGDCRVPWRQGMAQMAAARARHPADQRPGVGARLRQALGDGPPGREASAPTAGPGAA